MIGRKNGRKINTSRIITWKNNMIQYLIGDPGIMASKMNILSSASNAMTHAL